MTREISATVLLLLFSLAVAGVLAASITVNTNKDVYSRGETVVVSGKVPGASSPVVYAWEARDSSNRRIDFGDGQTDSSGNFQFSFKIPSTASLGAAKIYVSSIGLSGSKTFYIKEKSSLSINVKPTTVTKGGSVTISGSLSPALNGVGIKIYYKVGGSWNLLATVTTANGGKYSYRWSSITNTGTYRVKASWQGNDKYRGSTSREVTFKVTLPPGKITIAVDKKNIVVGGNVTITGRLSPEIDTSVEITYLPPSGDKIVRTVSVKKGSFRDVFKPPKAGIWKIWASWQGNTDYSSCKSDVLKLFVSKYSVEIRVNLSSQVVHVGEEIVVNGSLKPAVRNIEVFLVYIAPNGSSTQYTLSTSDLGTFTHTFTPFTDGEWRLIVSWRGSDVYAGANVTLSFIAERYPSTLNLTVSENIVAQKQEVVLEGYLDPGIENASILLSAQLGNGSIIDIGVALTDTRGYYRYVWRPEIGNYTIRAMWGGDRFHKGSSSNRVKLTVVEKLSRTNLRFLAGNNIYSLVNITALNVDIDNLDINYSRRFLLLNLSEGSHGTILIDIPKSLFEAMNSSPSQIVLASASNAFNYSLENSSDKAVTIKLYSRGGEEIAVFLQSYYVKIEVKDYGGTNLGKARVLLAGLDVPINRTGITDPSGYYLFKNIPPGEYLLEIFAGDEKIREMYLAVNGNLFISTRTSKNKWRFLYNELHEKYVKLSKDYEDSIKSYNELLRRFYELKNIISLFLIVEIFILVLAMAVLITLMYIS